MNNKCHSLKYEMNNNKSSFDEYFELLVKDKRSRYWHGACNGYIREIIEEREMLYQNCSWDDPNDVCFPTQESLELYNDIMYYNNNEDSFYDDFSEELDNRQSFRAVSSNNNCCSNSLIEVK
jgi:hypothetical protein